MALLATACGAAEKPSSQDDRAGLVFSRVNGDEWSVWVAEADGSDARKVVATGSVDGVSPDGRWLTYLKPYDEEGRLYLRDLETGTTRDLGPTMPLAWSPDGRTLATSNRSHLALVDAESGASRKVAEGEVWHATFSPDGKAIAFAEGYALEGNLRVLRLSDSYLSELAPGDDPVWGTSWIAFARWSIDDELGKDYGAVSTLYLIRPDGSGLHQLTIDEETAGQGKDDFLRYGLVPVAFSADGKRLLAEVSMELGPMELVTFSVPNGPGRKLTGAEEEGAIWTADLSADGTRILFEDGGLDDEANHAIFTMPFQGGKRHLLISNATQASWARGIPSKTDSAE